MFQSQALEQQIGPCYAYGYFKPQVNLCYGIWSNNKTHAMVFRATRNIMYHIIFSLEPNISKKLGNTFI